MSGSGLEAIVTNTRRIRVLWVMKELAVGGAERLLLEIAPILRGSVDYLPVAVFDEPRTYDSVYREAGFDVVTLRARTPLDPRWMVRLRRLARERDVDVVHLNLPYVGTLGRLASLGSDPAVVYTEHSLWSFYRPVSRMANALTFRLNDAAIAVSAGVLASMRPTWLRWLAGKPPRVIHNGISVDDVALEAKAGAARSQQLGLTRPSYGTAGHLRPEKGLDVLLRASVIVGKRCPSARGFVIGAGDAAGRLSTMRRVLEAPVEFLGLRDDARAFINALDVFVLPSRAEGLPIALLEAMALGKPIVASRTGGIPEAIEDGESGLLVDVGDAEGLARAIVRLLEGPELGKRLGTRAREVVRERFSAEATARGYLETYESVLMRPPH